MEIAKNEIPPSRPTSLGLILNYSVFLYEIIGQKQEAIDLARLCIANRRNRIPRSFGEFITR
jgi:hypothetical protein